MMQHGQPIIKIYWIFVGKCEEQDHFDDLYVNGRMM
jgi:hypothetical protein